VKTGTTLLTDGHRSYPGLTDYRHDPRTVGKMAGHIVLPWVHRVFALMKRWGLGTYHGLRRKHIDIYLNEFVFRYNRRFYRHVSFETILRLALAPSPDELLGYRRARQSPQRRADGPAPAAAPQDSRRHSRRPIKTSRKNRTQPRFGFDLPALDIDQPGTAG
jgi:hypothetical protein